MSQKLTENVTPRGIKICAEMMAKMLEIGFRKEDLPKLEKLFWKVRDKNGNLKRKTK